MTEDRRDAFKVLAADLKVSRTLGQQTALACSEFMENILWPAMRDARREIQNPAIVWIESEYPSIQVYHHKLIYACRGLTLYVEKTLDGHKEPQTILLEHVTEELIVQQIAAFLRAALDSKG
ncbi:MAG: hypothetical protein WAM82_22600 [Thermoanaerobaculia bacterium]